MAGTVDLSWDLPTQREDGTELTAQEIKHIDIEAKRGGVGAYSLVASLQGAQKARQFTDLALGTWYFRVSVYDTDEQHDSNPPEVLAQNGLAAPLSVTNLTAVVS